MAEFFSIMVYIGGAFHYFTIDDAKWWEIVLWPASLGVSIAEWAEDYGKDPTK